MNPYFTPKTTKRRPDTFDIILRALMGLIATSIVGLGIWMTLNSLHESAVVRITAGRGGNEMLQTNAVAKVSDQSR